MFRNILLAVDGSVHSDLAADYAGEMAAAFNATLFIVHVYPQTSDLLGYDDFEKLVARRKSSGQTILNNVRERLADRLDAHRFRQWVADVQWTIGLGDEEIPVTERIEAADTITDSPPGYPAEWVQDAVMSDGDTIVVRPIVPNDRDALQQMVRGLADERDGVACVRGARARRGRCGEH